MARTYVYIDGFNLYYGAVKNTGFKWLDLHKFCALLLPKNDIQQIRYFTALIDIGPRNPDGQFRQKLYLRALATLPDVTIHRGHFLTHNIVLPLADPPTRGPRYVEVTKTEEKGSDVNLATYLLTDGFDDLYDVAVVISNDSDLVLPIKIVRQRLQKVIGVINPHQNHPSVELKTNCDFFKTVHPGALAQSQLPTKIIDKRGLFEKPVSW